MVSKGNVLAKCYEVDVIYVGRRRVWILQDKEGL